MAGATFLQHDEHELYRLAVSSGGELFLTNKRLVYIHPKLGPTQFALRELASVYLGKNSDLFSPRHEVRVAVQRDAVSRLLLRSKNKRECEEIVRQVQTLMLQHGI